MFQLISAILNTQTKRGYREDIRRWAEIEYKHDADFAYNQMIHNKTLPDLILNR